MKLSSRNQLLKEADFELKNIKSEIKPKQIKSQEDWNKFVKDEKLASIYTEKWFSQVKELAKKGRIKIDLKSLNPSDKIEAQHLIRKLDAEINKLETGNIFGYGEIYILLKLISGLIAILGIGANVLQYFKDDVDLDKKMENNKNLEVIKKLKNPPIPKKDSPQKILKWIKSIVSMIKK